MKLLLINSGKQPRQVQRSVDSVGPHVTVLQPGDSTVLEFDTKETIDKHAEHLRRYGWASSDETSEGADATLTMTI